MRECEYEVVFSEDVVESLNYGITVKAKSLEEAIEKAIKVASERLKDGVALVKIRKEGANRVV